MAKEKVCKEKYGTNWNFQRDEDANQKSLCGKGGGGENMDIFWNLGTMQHAYLFLREEVYSVAKNRHLCK